MIRLLFLLLAEPHIARDSAAIVRVNQLGYLPDAAKVAVVCALRPMALSRFTVEDESGKRTLGPLPARRDGALGACVETWRLDFSALQRPGRYRIRAGDYVSATVRIADDVYRTSAIADSLTDREFWRLFTTMSEEGGEFPSENFVSNEKTYQYVIPTLQHSLTPHGVYLGVGPEQNFTYIANLQPQLAVIFDIRRQNAMLHLMYKALFELSSSRSVFVSRLFSRPLPPLAMSATPAEIFTAAAAAAVNDSAFDANWKAIVDRLRVTHGFALSDDDVASMRRVFDAFRGAGPDISYASRLGAPPPTVTVWHVTYAQLQTLTNADSVNMGFLASEERYRRLREFERRNLVVPVVGDFAGPKAIRGVGEYLKERGATVTAFYTSNVEQYLFTSGSHERFYRNVEALPIDSTSTFIRSLPPGPSPVGMAAPPATVANTSAFVSGIALINRALDAFANGQLTNYRQVTAMTKTDDWKAPP